MHCKAVILAAGKGKRLRSSDNDTVPKVMKQACGRPLIDYVLESLDWLSPEDIILVVGYGKEQVMEHCRGRGRFVEQKEQLGTGNAVDVCRETLRDHDGPVLVCAGDMPLVTAETYRELLAVHEREQSDCTILSAESADPAGYGRIVRENGSFSAIVEDRDCTPEQRKITEINSGIYVFDAKKLFSALREVTADNMQNEYYLTDVPGIMKRHGQKVSVYKIDDDWQVMGINTYDQLLQVEEVMRDKGLV